jgi:hypothetical protein
MPDSDFDEVGPSFCVEIGMELTEFLASVTEQALGAYHEVAQRAQSFLCGGSGELRVGTVSWPKHVLIDARSIDGRPERGPLESSGLMFEMSTARHDLYDDLTSSPTEYAVTNLRAIFAEAPIPLVASVGLSDVHVLRRSGRPDTWAADYLSVLVEDTVGWNVWASSINSGYSLDRCLASLLGLSVELGPFDGATPLSPMGHSIVSQALLGHR